MFPLKISEIASLIEGKLCITADLLINKLNRLEYSEIGDITFYVDEKLKDYYEKCQASCIIINQTQIIDDDRNYIRVANPYIAFIKLVNLVSASNTKVKKGISSSVNIGSNCLISESAYLGHNVVIGDNVTIGDEVIIESNTVLADNIQIGYKSKIYQNVSIYSNSIIGNNCIIQSGAVIGADGFGFTEDKTNSSYVKIPHIGNVVIKDNVEIGANSTIDRALVGSTLIESGVKIDNLVQVAHNCEIGENTGIAAQVGIAGSCKIGKRVRLGGQVGLAGHLEIADDVTIIAQSGASKSILNKGVYFGSPAKPQRDAFRLEAVLRRLPDLANEVSELKKQYKAN